MVALYNGAQVILIPAQVEAIDPVHKVARLATLATFAAIASMIGIPLGGTLSDRTRSRWGRRTPWIVAMSVISGALMVAMGFAGNLLTLGIVYTVLWLTSNMYQGAMSAILPDRVPKSRRGTASAVIGLATPLGALFGVNLASRVGQVWGYTVLGAVLVLASLALVLGAREGPSLRVTPGQAAPGEQSTPALRQRRNLVAGARSFLRAFTSRDFTLAFISRFALFLSYYSVNGYLFYTLSDYIGADQLPGGDVAVAVSTLTTVTVVAWVAVASICGWLADRLDRRKLFVGASALGLAATMTIPIASPTWAGMMLFSVFAGVSIGIYFAVDLAVMSLVLPYKQSEGRDFGILAVAAGLPGILAAPIAGTLISLTGGYSALYIFGIIAAAVGGITVLRIRSVR
jgi:MFS family permease